MDQQITPSGVFGSILLVSALLTAPLAWFLLRLYRRAVLRGMSQAAGVAEPAQAPTSATPPGQALRLTTVDCASLPAGPRRGSEIAPAMAASLRRILLAYGAAGLAFAAVFAGAWTALAGDGFLPIRFLVLLTIFAWPLVLTASQLAAMGWKDRFSFALLYLIVAGIVGVLGVAVSEGLNPLELVGLWFTLNGPITLILLASLSRRIRAVGPLILAIMAAGVAGTVALITIVDRSDQMLLAVVGVASPAGLSALQVVICLSLAGFVPLAVAAWWLLHLLGRRYRLKRLSDQSLTLDAIWLLFAAGISLILGAQNWLLLFTGAVAFVVYKLILGVALRWLVRPAVADGPPPTLLVLRVFSLGPRSLRLFDALSKYWLRAGPIVLIAGPDLVTGIVEPPEFLEFMGGRVSRSFVQGREDLEQRLAQLDTRPDPDGRYRVNGFFCRADTWQMTMRQLAARSDTVLMDLRSFSPSNQGCLYELGQLLNSVSLPQVLLIVDATTDLAFLKSTLQDLWRLVPVDSPNRSLQDPEVRLYEVRSGTGGEVRTLLSLLSAQLRSSGGFGPVSKAV